MGDDEISGSFRQKLDRDLKAFQSSVIKTLQLFNDNLQFHTNSMQTSLDENAEYFKPTQLSELHERTKRISISKVWIFAKKIKNRILLSNSNPMHRLNSSFQFEEESKSVGEKFTSSFRRRMEKLIDDLFPFVEAENDSKRMRFIVSIIFFFKNWFFNLMDLVGLSLSLYRKVLTRITNNSRIALTKRL